LVGADMENNQLNRMAGALPRDRMEVVRDLPLTELAGRLGSCQGFIGVDSGITQLAAATGIPCIALWGISKTALWKPLGKNVTFLESRLGINAITQDEVLAALPMVWSGAE
jgi:ADP-heptose:LPS heptosyltransferase